MVITRKVLQLTFSNSVGKNLTLTINEPAESLDGEMVGAAMDEIIASSAFGEESLAINKVDAKYVIQQEEAITLG